MNIFKRLFCKREKTISILLGAGFSAPQGYPIGNSLNSNLLECTGELFSFSSDGHLAISKDGSKPDFGYKTHFDKYFEFCIDLIHYYNDEIKKFDYEEFYDFYKHNARNDSKLKSQFIAKKYDSGKAEFEDYLFQIDNIFNQLISYYLKDREGKSWYQDAPFVLKPSFDGYTGFLNCMEHFIKGYTLNVHTLNHDLFFERLNNTEWINGKLCDGFEEMSSPYYGNLNGNMCRLERYTGNYNEKVRLYKLHGSKSYYVYSTQEKGTFIPETYIKGRWGIGSSDFYKEKKDKSGKLEYENCWVNYHSDFLTGTTSKIIRYKESLLYKKLFKCFKRNLKDAEMLIVIGYGCKDSEVNKIILEKFGRKKPCYIIDPFAGNNVIDFIKEMGSNTKLITKQLDSLQILDFK